MYNKGSSSVVLILLLLSSSCKPVLALSWPAAITAFSRTKSSSSVHPLRHPRPSTFRPPRATRTSTSTGLLLSSSSMSSSSAAETGPTPPVATPPPPYAAALDKKLFVQTPLVYSPALSKLVNNNRNVYLKLDNLQRSGSFKDRGMAHLCQHLQQYDNISEIMSSSGGNAGLAAATLAQELDMKCTVVVPKTTKPLVIDKLRNLLDATVQVVGDNWNQADSYVQEQIAKSGGHIAYIPPYEHELLWTGHSSIIDEIYQTLLDDEQPSQIILSVGGGGLLCGVLEGLQRQQQAQQSNNNKAKCQVVAAETQGACSFGRSWESGQLQKLDAITSIATSLGALQVSPTALQRAQEYGNVASALCTDAEAIDACWQFARDHRILVEPACGAALAVLYSGRLRQQFVPAEQQGPIVVEVCGGSGVNLELLQSWKDEFGL